MFDLTDKVAVVTGTARGMGQAMATALAEACANLMLVERYGTGSLETGAVVAELGRRASVAALDVSDPKQFRDITSDPWQVSPLLDAGISRIAWLWARGRSNDS